MLMDGSLAFRNARSHVRDFVFEGQELMEQRNEAIECRDSEAFLQMGIDAFHWIVRADNALRMADAADKPAFTEEVEQAIRIFAKAWLTSCELAERLIQFQQGKSLELNNLGEFRQCCTEMRAIVAFNESGDDESLPAGLIPFRDEALVEFKNGETSEFIPGTESHVS